ncbi:uncharacterized protein LOC126892389 isoform X1 [Diabrotica virgifera virgifera]|uniref:Uncharacterized protein LOC114326069 n=1 Tax=Diabrotica virgifera virgifera TaxID=50390 RepID=A0A6P7F8Q4_DIAVI|nr:uncharacterized protein LOC126878484 isoform X1 [Diabrotica virgifera virgifera]XP_050497317.1 uncharacterized protein LOC126878570 isoform X1 [Diabrotica virgifera virgifera]XP_050499758.1 uncharacterized protein LOC126880109 isoform X1 [Diabrotica virgifera virgifera]XP_050502813.1 uncharacterized protein LOC126882051 isoform X1 [Diabrotica virgifera virgifera]XP_050504249.1 uncharacterized protein LOC126883073 isoform X1 [Diabrotica virgifera virgifera]XP_050504745.1 uncharacterized prot
MSAKVIDEISTEMVKKIETPLIHRPLPASGVGVLKIKEEILSDEDFNYRKNYNAQIPDDHPLHRDDLIWARYIDQVTWSYWMDIKTTLWNDIAVYHYYELNYLV